jgi:hypothetical protein
MHSMMDRSSGTGPVLCHASSNCSAAACCCAQEAAAANAPPAPSSDPSQQRQATTLRRPQRGAALPLTECHATSNCIAPACCCAQEAAAIAASPAPSSDPLQPQAAALRRTTADAALPLTARRLAQPAGTPAASKLGQGLGSKVRPLVPRLTTMRGLHSDRTIA